MVAETFELGMAGSFAPYVHYLHERMRASGLSGYARLTRGFARAGLAGCRAQVVLRPVTAGSGRRHVGEPPRAVTSKLDHRRCSPPNRIGRNGQRRMGSAALRMCASVGLPN
jgi:hypothetical protein